MEFRGFLQEGTLNQFGDTFVQSCYPSKKLTSAAIGMREWVNPHSPLMIVCYEMDDAEVLIFCNRLTEKLRDGVLKIGPITAVTNNNRLLPPPSVSLFIVKSKPQRILQNQEHLQKILNKTCITILLREDFPEELENIKNKFKEVIPIAEKDYRVAAEIVADQLLSKSH